MDAFSFTKVNAEFPVVQPQPSHAEIVAKLLETEDLSNDNDDVIETEDKCVYCPDRSELLKISRPCKNYPCFQKLVQLFNLMLGMLLA